jgi:hypothetical protein
MKKPGLWIALAAVALVAFLAYSTLNQTQYRVEVCVEFQGRDACRTASAETEQQALRTATDNACALIASGMTDSMACGRTAPKSVRWLSGK